MTERERMVSTVIGSDQALRDDRDALHKEVQDLSLQLAALRSAWAASGRYATASLKVPTAQQLDGKIETFARHVLDSWAEWEKDASISCSNDQAFDYRMAYHLKDAIERFLRSV